MPLLSQKSRLTYIPKISIVWFPRVKRLLLLWKAKTAWIKRSIDYVTLQRYNPGGSYYTQRNSSVVTLNRHFWYKRSMFKFENYIASDPLEPRTPGLPYHMSTPPPPPGQRNSSVPQSSLLIQKKQNLKITLPQKNGSRIKTPSSKSLILVSFCRKRNVLRIDALTNLI